MPWYMNPSSTRRVVNRIALHYSRLSIQEQAAALDHVTQRLWHKQEFFHENNLHGNDLISQTKKV